MSSPVDPDSDESLTVVLPVYRNRPHLPELVDRLRRVLDGLGVPWEAVFVDDCGGDGAREWLAERAAAEDRLVLVANPRNLGQHAAIVRGLAVARGRRVVVMDADLQDAPEDVPKLLAAWRPGLGAVFARRSVAYQSATRDWTGRWLKRLVRWLSGSRLPAGVGTFVLLGREARERVLAQRDERPYLPMALVRTRLPLGSVAIEKGARHDLTSAYTGTRRLRLGLQALSSALRWRLGRR